MRSVHLVHAGLAWLFVVALLVQVFLAGLGVFEGPARFAIHTSVGYMLSLIPIILLVGAAVGRMGRRQLGLAALMFVLFLLQSVFVGLRGTAPFVAALHPVNGFLILLLAIETARSSWAAHQASPAPGGA
jgi:hypothetical protein